MGTYDHHDCHDGDQHDGVGLGGIENIRIEVVQEPVQQANHHLIQQQRQRESYGDLVAPSLRVHHDL